MTSGNNQANPFLVLAIDGGAASGKSSTSRLLAKRRNLLHVDTGRHYRSVTLACIEAGIPPEEGSRLQSFLGNLSLDSNISGNASYLCFNNEAPPEDAELRSQKVNHLVSPFAALPSVRQTVKAYQRNQVELARKCGFDGIVMDGRDIGTVILPDADLKVFLIADPATREKRRSLEGASDTIASRDKTDSTRSIAPLRPAEDAVVIDNSGIPLEQVVDQIESLVDARVGCSEL